MRRLALASWAVSFSTVVACTTTTGLRSNRTFPSRGENCTLEIIEGDPPPERPSEMIEMMTTTLPVFQTREDAMIALRQRACAIGAEAIAMIREHSPGYSTPHTVTAAALVWRHSIPPAVDVAAPVETSAAVVTAASDSVPSAPSAVTVAATPVPVVSSPQHARPRRSGTSASSPASDHDTFHPSVGR